MRLKTHGETITQKDNDELKRNIKANNKELKKHKGQSAGSENTTPQTQDIEIFLLNSPNFFLSQWISIVDKIFKKPVKITKTERKRKTPVVETCPIENPTYLAREKLSQAIIKLWKEKRLTSEGQTLYKKYNVADKLNNWNDKVHPYKPLEGSRCFKVANNGILTGKNWYKTFASFVGNKNAKDLDGKDYDTIATAIYSHLYKREIIKIGDNNNQAHEREYGLIKHKANSISKNARRLKQDTDVINIFSKNEQSYVQALQKKPIDWNNVKDCYQLNKLIKNLKEKEKDFNIKYYDAVKCLNDHYRFVFRENGKLKENLNENLWEYHLMIENTVKYRYPKKRKTKHEGISEDLLHNLALKIKRNRQLSFVLRLGKVIHYEACEQEEFAPLSLAQENNNTKIISSAYWMSDWQTKIKQRESFVRQWLSTISVANSTMARLLDPENKLDSFLTGEDRKKIDFFSQQTKEDVFEHLLKPDVENPSFDKQCAQVFGVDKLYDSPESRNKFINALTIAAGNLRNAAFHFKNIKDFENALSPIQNKYKDATNKVKIYIKKHLEKQQELLKEKFKSANVEKYLNKVQFEGIYTLVTSSKKGSMPLPKFNKLLLRAKGTKNGQDIINPVNKREMDATNSYRLQYICLKSLYETNFSKWVEESENLHKWVESATEWRIKMTIEFKRNTGKAVDTKVKRLRKPEPGSKLLDYMAQLNKEIALETQLQQQQNKYESNKGAAIELSNYLEEFKQDVVIFAFNDYLNNKNLTYLKRQNYTLSANKPWSLKEITTSVAEGIERPWLYILLNLMPIEFVNHLALSIRKLRALTPKVTNEEYAGVYEAISLYLDMHDVNLEVGGLLKTDIAKFYECEEDIRMSGNEVIPIKGLREVSRFGNLEQLSLLCSDYKVTGVDICNLTKSAENVQTSQKEMIEFNKEKSKRNGINNINADAYRKHLTAIIEHRELKNKVNLVDHKKIHQLMKAVSGRLLGFSQIWERDIYFVILALIFINKTNVEGLDAHINKGDVINSLRHIFSEKYDLLEKINGLLDVPYEKLEIRNNLAHFNKIREKTSEGINLTNLINDTRELMSYDRKLKNAVSKSIVALLERNNIVASKNGSVFKMSKHKLILDNICAKEIEHLGKRRIPEKLLSDDYVQVVAKMFGSKKKKVNSKKNDAPVNNQFAGLGDLLRNNDN